MTLGWQNDILGSVKKPMARALFSAGRVVDERDGAIVVGLPNETHRSKSEGFRGDVEAAIAAHLGHPVKLILVVDTHGPVDEHAPAPSPARPSSNSPASRTAPPRPEEEDIDLTDLVDAPPGVMKSPEDRLAEAFPGSVFVDEQR